MSIPFIVENKDLIIELSNSLTITAELAERLKTKCEAAGITRFVIAFIYSCQMSYCDDKF